MNLNKAGTLSGAAYAMLTQDIAFSFTMSTPHEDELLVHATDSVLNDEDVTPVIDASRNNLTEDYTDNEFDDSSENGDTASFSMDATSDEEDTENFI